MQNMPQSFLLLIQGYCSQGLLSSFADVAGSEIYQEMLAKALAKYFGATLLLSDSHAFMGVRSVIPIWVSLLLTENNSNE